MDMQNDKKQEQQQPGKARLLKTLVYGCSALGFVLAVGTAGFVVVGNLSMKSVAQVAEVGPALYGSTLQMPQT